VRCHAERESRLAHRGAGADDDEVGRLQAREKLVEVRIACRYARDRLVPAVELLEAVEAATEQLLEGGDRVRRATLSHLEHERLGPVHGLRHVLRQAEADLGDLLRDAD
jgi:hypothetical protein